MKDSPRIFIVAGEASGDQLGGRLMEALKVLRPQIRFSGIGGEAMAAAGLKSLFPMSDLSVMGFVEVISHLPRLLKRMNETIEAVLEARSDMVITIDAPDFSFRIGKRIRKLRRSLAIVHYVAPSVWAWRPGRAKKVARFLTHLLALLPFEPPYFQREGLGCTFVGHPAIEAPENGDAARFRETFNIPTEMPVVLMLPGSRKAEIKHLLPIFQETLQNVQKKFGVCFIAIPTIPVLKTTITEAMKDVKFPYTIVVDQQQKQDAFAAAHAALAASGTVVLELGLKNIPTVVAYRVNPLSAFLARQLVRVDFASLINIAVKKEIVPEFLQDQAQASLLTKALLNLMKDTPERQKQITAMAGLKNLFSHEQEVPSFRAAHKILEIIDDPHR